MIEPQAESMRSPNLLSAFFFLFFSSCREKKNGETSLSRTSFGKLSDIEYGSREFQAGLFL
jgi:hypothetical protein